MYRSLLSVLLLPVAAQAARGRSSCKPSPAKTVTEIVTVTGPPSINPSGFSAMPTTVTSSSYTTIKTSLTSEELPEQPTSVPSESQPSAPREDSATKASSSPYADATAIDVDIPETEQCGNDDRLIMPGLAWTVANSMYNADQMEGTQCTDFKQVLEASDGTRLVEWTSTSTIEKVADTEDLCKGYSNIGIGANLRQRLSDIKEIPAYFKWSRTTDGEFKGAHIFDFMTSPVEGAGEEPGSHEFMLFLKIWGGQVPIGYGDGPVDTFDMYGTTWKLYEGENEGSGQMVRSMIPETPFEGEFMGDLKVWLDTMSENGYAASDEFVNIGNGGVEVFYGDSEMKATVALDIVV